MSTNFKKILIIFWSRYILFVPIQINQGSKRAAYIELCIYNTATENFKKVS